MQHYIKNICFIYYIKLQVVCSSWAIFEVGCYMFCIYEDCDGFPFAITHFLNLLVMQQNVVTFLYHGKIIKCKKIVGLYPTSLSFCGIVVYQPTNNCIRARDPRF